MTKGMSFVRRASQLGTLVHTWLCGIKVGTDRAGNSYYCERSAPPGRRERRWVIYAGEPEASRVPPEWHSWLHRISKQPLAEGSAYHKPWQKPHEANQTGTTAAYYPPGHVLARGQRAPATGDYRAWKPEN